MKKGGLIKADLSNTIHIWYTKFNDDIKHYKLFQSWLSKEEMARAEKLKLPYRHRFTLTRGILRNLLSNYIGQPPKKINFSYTKFGKPLFNNPSLNQQIEFNLSHSHNRAVFAFTQGTPLGIDLEYKIARKYIDKIAYRFFSANDYAQLIRLAGKTKVNAFFNAWVRNEALLKALGYHLQTHPFSQYKAHNKQLKGVFMEKKAACSLFTLALHPDFAAALAIKGKSKTIIIKNYATRPYRHLN